MGIREKIREEESSSCEVFSFYEYSWKFCKQTR
jgi:hypothetical protein